jgi:hypothetical protein
MCTAPPPARSTTWSRPWGWRRGSPSRRCPGSVASWMVRWPPSGPARWPTPPSPMCSWMPPTSRPGWTAGWCHGRWSSPPACVLMAAGRCWAWTSATPKMARSGPPSCAASKPEGSPVSSSSSPTPTPGSRRPSPRSWPGPAGSAAGSTSSETSWPESLRAQPRWWPRPSGPSSPSRLGPRSSTRSTRSRPCSPPSSQPWRPC